MNIYNFSQIQKNKIFEMIDTVQEREQRNFNNINEDCDRVYRKWLNNKVTNVFMLDFLKAMV